MSVSDNNYDWANAKKSSPLYLSTLFGMAAIGVVVSSVFFLGDNLGNQGLGSPDQYTDRCIEKLGGEDLADKFKSVETSSDGYRRTEVAIKESDIHDCELSQYLAGRRMTGVTSLLFSATVGVLALRFIGINRHIDRAREERGKRGPVGDHGFTPAPSPDA